MRPVVRFGLPAVAACAVLLTAATPAFARDNGPTSPKGAGGGRSITIDQVDASGPTAVVDGVLRGAEPSTITVTSNGKKIVPQSVVRLDPTGKRTETVLVIDNSIALGNTVVQLAKNGVEPLLPGAGASARTAVVSTGGGATIEQGMTEDASAARAGLERVEPFATSALWDSLVRSADLFTDSSSAGLRQVVVFAAAPDTASLAASSAAVSALRLAGAQVRVVALPGGVDIGGLSDLAGSLGGSISVQQADTGIVPAEKNIALALKDRFRMELPRTGAAGTIVPLTLASGSAVSEIAFEPGDLTVGAVSLSPVTPTGGIAGVISNIPGIKFLLLLLGAGAAGLLVWAILSVVVPDENSLGRRLKAYEASGLDEQEESGDKSVVATALVQRAVALTGQVAQRRGVLEKTELLLEHASVPLRAAEALFLLGASVVVLFLLTFVITSNLIIAVLVGGLAFILPKTILKMKVRRRQKAFQGQLPDMLALLSGTLRAGYSIAQGFEAVSREIDEPMGYELRRVVTESRLGRPLEEALEGVAERMDSEDFAWAVMAIRIQREVGGNLAELLMTVSETMTQRERLRRDVLSLTAEGRMSAFVLGMLPPGLGLVMWVMNPDYIARLFQPGIGYTILGIALVAMLIGFAWMKKIITVEV